MTFVYKNLEQYRNPPGPLCINISGGRTSAYQAAHLIEANGGARDDWFFTFQNTGLERPETYGFIDKFSRHFGIKVTWLEHDRQAPNWVREVTYETAARNGEPFDALLNTPLNRRDGTFGVRPLPNPAQRVCTAELKTKTCHRYIRKVLGWKEFYAAIGYRADEVSRFTRRQKMEKKGMPEGGWTYCPMIPAGVTKDDVEAFWYVAPFDLGLDTAFGNCDLCFMASTWKIKERMLLMAMEAQIKPRFDGPIPERVLRWIMWEERKSDREGPFRRDRPGYRELWNQVCVGFMDSAVPENKDDRCGRCTD